MKVKNTEIVARKAAIPSTSEISATQNNNGVANNICVQFINVNIRTLPTTINKLCAKLAMALTEPRIANHLINGIAASHFSPNNTRTKSSAIKLIPNAAGIVNKNTKPSTLLKAADKRFGSFTSLEYPGNNALDNGITNSVVGKADTSVAIL